ncbi:MAG: AAA family ATPase, partial [Archaeoglobaceae archaeon]
ELPVEVNASLETVAEFSEGLSGRDLVEKIIKASLHKVIAEGKDVIETSDLLNAIEKLKISSKQPPKHMFI